MTYYFRCRVRAVARENHIVQVGRQGPGDVKICTVQDWWGEVISKRIVISLQNVIVNVVFI